MHQHVQPDLLLHAHAVLGLGGQERIVVRIGELAGLVAGTCLTHLQRLRERTDRGGREARQLQRGGLGQVALRVAAVALCIGRGQRGKTRGDGRVVHARRTTARFDARTRMGQRCFGPCRRIDRIGQHAQLAKLLLGERQPAAQFVIELLFVVQIDRAMQQRTRWRQPQRIAADMTVRIARQHQGVVQMGAPDVAAVDQTGRQHATGRQRLDHRIELFWRTDQIHMQAIDRQRGGKGEVVFQCTEVRRHQHLGARGLGQHRVGMLEGSTCGLVQVLHQQRLIQLHPRRAGGLEFAQQLHVHRQQRIQQVQRVAAIGGLGQPQESHRADQHRTGLDPQRLGLAVLGQRLVAAHREGLAGMQFGHQVVVVGVEPLGHFQRMQVDAIALQATRHREVAAQRLGIGECAVAGRDRIEQEGGIEHLVIQAEIVARRHIHAGLALQLPVAFTQLGRGVLQRRGGALAGPEGFERALEFALGTDARKTQVGNSGHWNVSSLRRGIEERRNRAPSGALQPVPPRQRPSPPRANRMP